MAELRLLLCDDDPDMLALLTRRLEKMGLEHDAADDGRKAKALLDQHAYDVIVTDIYMPEATGLEVLQYAKQKDRDIQVVIVTSAATLDNAIDALNHGAFGYLTKPFDHLIVFDNMVTRAVEHRHLLVANRHKAEAQKRRGDMLEDEVADRVTQLQRTQKGLLDLLGSLPDGILLVEEGGKVVLSSPVGERWLARDKRSEGQPIRAFLSQVNSSKAEREANVQVEGQDLLLMAMDFPADGEVRRKAVIVRKVESEGIGAGSLVTETVQGIKKSLAALYQQGVETQAVLDLANQFAVLEQLAGWTPKDRGVAKPTASAARPAARMPDVPVSAPPVAAPTPVTSPPPVAPPVADSTLVTARNSPAEAAETELSKLNVAELAAALLAAARAADQTVQAERVGQQASPPGSVEVPTTPVSRATRPKASEPVEELPWDSSEDLSAADEPDAPRSDPEPGLPTAERNAMDPATGKLDSGMFRPRVIPEEMNAKLGEPPPIRPANGKRRPLRIGSSAADTQIFRRVLEKMSGETVIGPSEPEPDFDKTAIAPQARKRTATPPKPEEDEFEPDQTPTLRKSPKASKPNLAAEPVAEPVAPPKRARSTPPVESEPSPPPGKRGGKPWPPNLPSNDPEWDDSLEVNS